jgi:hypothetical protein
MIESIQLRWDRLIAAGSNPAPLGKRVTVTFTIDSSGKISAIGKIDQDAGELAANWCIAAINPGQDFSYGPWTQDMVATLGASQQLTFAFLYR